MQLKSRAVNEALLLEALGFIFVALLIWVNEYLDLPHMVLGAAVTGVSWLTFRRLAYLESLLILCAGCQRVGDEGRWLEFELFVESRDSLETTHGMCPDCQTTLGPAFSRPLEAK